MRKTLQSCPEITNLNRHIGPDQCHGQVDGNGFLSLLSLLLLSSLSLSLSSSALFMLSSSSLSSPSLSLSLFSLLLLSFCYLQCCCICCFCLCCHQLHCHFCGVIGGMDGSGIWGSLLPDLHRYSQIWQNWLCNAWPQNWPCKVWPQNLSSNWEHALKSHSHSLGLLSNFECVSTLLNESSNWECVLTSHNQNDLVKLKMCPQTQKSKLLIWVCRAKGSS